MSLADICPSAERKASGSEISVRSGGKQYAFAGVGDAIEARAELNARNRKILDAAEDGGHQLTATTAGSSTRTSRMNVPWSTRSPRLKA